MEMGVLWIMALVLGALLLLTLALMGSYRLGRRRRRDEVVVELMDDDAFVRDRGRWIASGITSERGTHATPSGGVSKPARPTLRQRRPAPEPGTRRRGERRCGSYYL